MLISPDDVAKLLPGRRWSGTTGKSIGRIDVIDETTITDGPPVVVLAIARVEVDDDTAMFHLPIVVGDNGTVRDATEEPVRLAPLGELMAHGQTLKGERGVFEFSGAGLDPSSPPGAVSVRSLSAEQSNSSLVLDEAVLIKLYRRIHEGPNPDLELSRVLTTEGFDRVAPQLGAATYRAEDSEAGMDLALAQQFIPDARDGWEEITRSLSSLYEQVDDADATEDIPWLVENRIPGAVALVTELGEITAEMHVVLAREHLDPDFAPEPVMRDDLDAWRQRALDWLRRAARVEEARIPVGEVEERLERIAAIAPDGKKLRIHGDFHLGQALVTPRGALLTDFEGEPARDLPERRAKSSPLKDVAGMLRSFDYASLSVLAEQAPPHSPEWERLRPWAEAWAKLAADRYTHAYLSRCHEGAFLPGDAEAVRTLIHAFAIEKALYEVVYDATYRPGWEWIPAAGLRNIVRSKGG